MWHLLKTDFSQAHTMLFFLLPIGVTQALTIKQIHISWVQWLCVCLLISWPYIWGYFYLQKYNNTNLLTRLPIPHYHLGLRRLLFLNTWGIVSFTLFFIISLLSDSPRHFDWTPLIFTNGIILGIYAILLIDQDIKHKSHHLFFRNKVNIIKYFRIFVMFCFWLLIWSVMLGTAFNFADDIGDTNQLITLLSPFEVTFFTPSVTLAQAFVTFIFGLILSFISLYTFKHRKSYLA